MSIRKPVELSDLADYEIKTLIVGLVDPDKPKKALFCICNPAKGTILFQLKVDGKEILKCKSLEVALDVFNKS